MTACESLHVAAHEAGHALVAVLQGGRLSDVRLHARGGHVDLTRRRAARISAYVATSAGTYRRRTPHELAALGEGKDAQEQGSQAGRRDFLDGPGAGGRASGRRRGQRGSLQGVGIRHSRASHAGGGMVYSGGRGCVGGPQRAWTGVGRVPHRCGQKPGADQLRVCS